MQHARAFGRSREAPAPPADPSKRWEYLQYQNQQQQKRALSHVPKGSRVFQRNRDLEETVRQREAEQQRRREEEELARQPSAQRLARAFGGGRRAAAPPEPAAPKQPPGRAFGATRQRQEADQQALALELETPWHWQGAEVIEQPEPTEDEFGTLVGQ